MTKSIRQVMIAAVAAGVVSAACVAAAQPMEGGWHHGEGMEILHALNLTEAQKAQAHKIEEAAWAQARPLMDQMHAVHEQLATQLLSQNAVTADQLAPLMQQEEQYRAQMDQQHLSTVLQIRALLTTDQLAQASAAHQKLEALHEQEHAILKAPAGQE